MFSPTVSFADVSPLYSDPSPPWNYPSCLPSSQVQGTGALFMVEMVVRTDTRNVGITIKTEATELLFQFAELWGNCLMGFYR